MAGTRGPTIYVENPDEYDAYSSRISRFLLNYNVLESNIAPFALQLSGAGEVRFFDTYEFTFGSTDAESRERLIFSIIRLRTRDSLGQAIDEYYSFEDDDVKLPPDGGRILQYGQGEDEFLQNLYSDVEPELQISLDPTPINNNIHQASVPIRPIPFDSLSSLGEISQEGFTVSAATGSDTGLITEQTETITDVGGVVARGRRDTAGDVTTTVTTGGTTTTTTVTTSGY